MVFMEHLLVAWRLVDRLLVDTCRNRASAHGLLRNVSPLPGLREHVCRRTLDADACVDGDAAFGKPEHRIEVQLCNRRDVLAESGQPVNEIDESRRVGGLSATKAAHEPTCLALSHELLGVDVGER